MMKQIRVETCRFKRINYRRWEYGIIVDEGSGPIIHRYGRQSGPAAD
jgi:hypothetical protein